MILKQDPVCTLNLLDQIREEKLNQVYAFKSCFYEMIYASLLFKSVFAALLKNIALQETDLMLLLTIGQNLQAMPKKLQAMMVYLTQNLLSHSTKY